MENGAERGVAVVTGCRGGIGRAIVQELGAAGFSVVGSDLGEEAGGDGPYYRCDLADTAALGDMLERIGREQGLIRVLVNNGAHYGAHGFFDITEASYEHTMAVNVRAPFFACQIVARALIAAKKSGQIVNIASYAGRAGSTITDYGTSKAAVIGLTKSLGKSLAPHGIRVNAIAPGVVDTAMGRMIPKPQRDRNIAATPIGRIAEPVEMARVVRFLASEDSSYMTAAVLDVNGGLL